MKFAENTIPLQIVTDLDRWLDANVGHEYKQQLLAQDWARVVKVIEEIGEAISNLIGYTGQNPRKGIYSNEREMLDELADTVITGVLAIQHFTKDAVHTDDILAERWRYREKRMLES